MLRANGLLAVARGDRLKIDGAKYLDDTAELCIHVSARCMVLYQAQARKYLPTSRTGDAASILARSVVGFWLAVYSNRCRAPSREGSNLSALVATTATSASNAMVDTRGRV
jgi:hypothetical protein